MGGAADGAQPGAVLVTGGSGNVAASKEDQCRAL